MTTRLNRPAGLRTTSVGEHRLTYIPDGSVQLDPRRWYHETDPSIWDGEHAGLLDPEGYLAASIGGLLVEHGDRAMLIDAGFGPRTIPAAHTHPALGVLGGGDLPTGLKQAGVDPARIDTVALTHVHDDHFGWVLRPGPAGTPFPNAAVAAGAADWAAWREPVAVPTKAVHDGDEVFPGVTAMAAPGHTPGHTCYVIESGGERLIAFGDALHSPAQAAHPEWPVLMDVDRVRGIESRRRVLAALAQDGVRGFGIHFADVQFGRIISGPDGPYWEYDD
ncbi:MBL fold metallo-hydrolase [Glycomyces endophyticus]|uniref:MBL fold metallo-hydrolase n=1 Tax=Glycomyces endophyticus TaxID=480996 RepID=A0ABN2GJL7_9ACTN